MADQILPTKPGRTPLDALLVTGAVATIGLLIVVPLASVFAEAFSQGPQAWWEAIAHDPDTRHAIWLSLTVAPVAVAFNTVFGIAAAWLVARFRFPGRSLLVALFDVPFSVSPVVAGLALVLIFGRQGILGPTLAWLAVKVIFAWPGLVLATTFVTLPLVVRELIPVMEAIGPEEELAAVSLGANGWQVFWRVTLPNIRWALLHGIVLANARAMENSGRCMSSAATSPAPPTRCRCASKNCFRNTGLPPRWPSPACWQPWRWSRWWPRW